MGNQLDTGQVAPGFAPPAQDTLRGVKEIAKFIGEKERRTSYLLERGYIPAIKVGRIWNASKLTLTKFYQGAEG